MQIENRDYELIDFRSKLTNTSIQMRGFSLAQGYIAVADNRIYNTISGEPLVRGRFENTVLALDIAKWIEKTLHGYFEIWQAYPQANIISWCKYTVNNGARLFETIEILNTLEIVTQNDVKIAYKQSIEFEKKWKL